MKKIKEKYGFWAAFALTLTGTLGSSLLITYNMVTMLSGYEPVFLILAWLMGGLVILPENLLMIEPAINYQENGTTYAWVKKAGWKVIGFWFGWILVVAVSAVAMAGISIGLGQLISMIIDSTLKTDFLSNEWIGKGIALGILAILVLAQIFIKNSTKYTQYLFWALTILPIVFILIIAVIYGNLSETLSEGQKAINNQGLAKVFVSSGLLIPAITYTSYAYSGTEFSTYITAEIKTPKKTVPKVIIFSVITIIVIYVVYGIALLSLTPIDKLGNKEDIPVPLNLQRMPQWAKITFQIMAIFLFVGSINTFLITYGWLTYKLAEKRDLPKFFKKLNKNNIPWAAMLFVVGIAVIYILANDLYKIVGYFSISVSILKIIMASTTVHLRRTDKNYQPIYKNGFFYTLLVLSFVVGVLQFGGGIAAIFFLKKTDSPTQELIVDIIFVVVLIALIPIGYLKFYFQDFKKKKIIKEKHHLKSNKELWNENDHNLKKYLEDKKAQNEFIDKEVEKMLVKEEKGK